MDSAQRNEISTSERYAGGIDSFKLKVLAIIGMTCNHVAHVIGSSLPWQATFIIYSFGGITFPIMAFLIVEGYIHTSNLKRYALRLLVFALISQVPYTLCFGWTANVLFTLLMGLVLLWAWDNIKNRGLFFLLFVGITAISYFCDWSLIGPAMVFLFYILRFAPRIHERKHAQTLAVVITMAIPYVYTIAMGLSSLIPEIQGCLDTGASAVEQGVADNYRIAFISNVPVYLSAKLLKACDNLAYALVGYTIATICLCNYNGKRGHSMKWFFYAYYPAHLLVIWAISKLIGT